MIAIVNVSPDDAPNEGENKYEVRINSQVICEFKHDRKVDGLAQCLRDAADAVEKARATETIDAIQRVFDLNRIMSGRECIKG